MNNAIYPPGPSDIPAGLTRPGATYKSRAWLAMGGLMLFIGLYISLTAWFAWTAWRMFYGFHQGAEFELSGALAGAAGAFLFVFMVKALFAVKHSGESRDIEVTRQEHRRLFEFLYQLADEAGAPRPYKVYLSPQVNAAVFYNLSLLNLFFPSKKNLLIGLGLVNVLNLGEFKAVLAHEFGHFAQRSMAVGRWVYIAHQIAAHIINKRDMLDGFLNGLSRVDLRIAWVGWILKLVVWSIRSLLDAVFSLVVISERALSRQMEFQADLVAVSLTGSDALVHALNKLNAGDEAWNRTLNFVNQELSEKRRVADVFAIQRQVLDKLRKIYSDDSYGCVRPVPAQNPEEHRVFSSTFSLPPQMWSTHPDNTAREDNAKQTYIACAIDTRDAWQVFDKPDQVRAQMSAHLVANVEVELQDCSMEESLAKLNKNFSKPWLMPCYRGAYLGRAVVRRAATLDELYLQQAPELSVAELDTLYPASLSENLEALRGLYEEKRTLQALYDKVVRTSGGVIQFRGNTIKRRQLPKVIAEVGEEIKTLEEEVYRHDQKVRSLHMAIAKNIGQGWDAYLTGLTTLLHFAEHSEAEINDVSGYVANVWAVVTADGRVSESEIVQLTSAVESAHSAMLDIYNSAAGVELDAKAQALLGVGNLQAAFGEYNLPKPRRDNINEWVKVFDGWTGAFQCVLSQLRFYALEQLLLSEAKLAGAYRRKETLPAAPSLPAVPTKYRTLVPGKERELQKKLNFWDSFITATGTFPALARFCVALTIVGGVLWWGQSLGKLELSIYNGLANTVTVTLNNTMITVGPLQSQTVSIPPAQNLEVITKNPQGAVIEEFTQALGSKGFQHNIYNVAAAAPLVQWWAVYGNVAERSANPLGTPRWLSMHSDYFFEEPPSQIKTESNGGSRSVISGQGDLTPTRQLKTIDDQEQGLAMIRAHVRWDDSRSPYYMMWLQYLGLQPDALTVLKQRLQQEPESVALLRQEQDLTQGEYHKLLCEQHTQLAEAKPDSGDLRYLAIRCQADGAARNAAYADGLAQWPDNPWFALAAAYDLASTGEWQPALELYEKAVQGYRPLKAYLSDTLLRLHRVVGNSGRESEELVKLNDRLHYALTLESGRGLNDSPYLAFHLLQRGELEQAMAKVQEEASIYPHILSLVAASSGAKDEWIEAALAQPLEDGSEESIAWLLWSLARREGADAQIYTDYLTMLGRDYTEQIFAFENAVRNAKNAKQQTEAAQLLNALPLFVRGYALSAAVVYTRGHCPEYWVEEANKLLYAHEHPYLVAERS